VDASHDLRLDLAYTDFYLDQRGGNNALPSPLDTTTLFNSIARQLLEHSNSQAGDPAADRSDEPGVQQLFRLVQGVQ
jgi:hypothetical protein